MRAPARIAATRVGATRDPRPGTYVCRRCGIEMSRSGGRSTTGLCRDCLAVDDHGTDRGYYRHRRRGETPCRACTDAHSRRMTENRKNKKETAP